MGQETQQKAGLNATQKILIAGFAVIIVVAVVLGVLILTKENPQPAAGEAFPETGGTLVADENNINDAIAELNRKAEAGMFDAKMTTVWNFPNGTSVSEDAYVANLESNHGPIVFKLLLGEEEEVIYASPKIPLGSAVKDIKLTKDLDPGTYECVCFYQLYDENEEPVSDVSISVTVNVAA